MSTPRIETYRFGHIVVDGQPYDRDVIILPDRVLGGWWRQEGHVLYPDDLHAVFEAAPDLLVVGQGAYGRMEVTRKTRQALQAAGIELIAAPTEEACQTYNKIREQQAVAAALHLTC
ncbi:MAG: Mth938-like domain-containing protein [Anaerolineae bacterium]